ncbi:pheromone B beta 1 receptor [Coprinopsis cinerea okayama7|uniref:Pheromone B beta 1 receptor n=1 Tax=Coprinopsis cinerea (strain Okayama-7 / 130 / ATCC MYA-4618 / FGSC 9003) TaxID=240176 RepID=D6RQ18_COPC7|nr:pheromone B beta 1 receptor [Coprinopsis cinerea okayama7\|eukprot:XP_002910432.1 pheromone B beta 1 receptor [Coprinopsis cinerea okayama7\
MHAELPVASFISAALVLVPIPWHWKARNVPTLSLCIWLFVLNVINGVGSIVWAGNTRLVVPAWCDIATKLMIGGNLAIPTSLIALCVQLERLASARDGRLGVLGRAHRRQLLDYGLCLFLPIMYMVLHSIVQGHRFEIFEDFGCYPHVHVSIPAIFILWLPPLVCLAGSVVLLGCTFRHFVMHRIIFAGHLAESNTLFTQSRFFRSLSMAVVQTVVACGFTAFSIWFSARDGLKPWSSWAEVHAEFGIIGLFSREYLRPGEFPMRYILWWAVPVSSMLFSVFFVFGEDALEDYRAWLSILPWCRPLPRSERKSLRPLKLSSRSKRQESASNPNLIFAQPLEVQVSVVRHCDQSPSYSVPCPTYYYMDSSSDEPGRSRVSLPTCYSASSTYLPSTLGH